MSFHSLLYLAKMPILYAESQLLSDIAFAKLLIFLNNWQIKNFLYLFSIGGLGLSGFSLGGFVAFLVAFR
jgi:CHASE2 domain-containing sensor protein